MTINDSFEKITTSSISNTRTVIMPCIRLSTTGCDCLHVVRVFVSTTENLGNYPSWCNSLTWVSAWIKPVAEVVHCPNLWVM